jgi:hypothetical protein
MFAVYCFSAFINPVELMAFDHCWRGQARAVETALRAEPVTVPKVLGPQMPGTTSVAQNLAEPDSASPKYPNRAGVSLEIVPNGPVSIGEEISFRITAKQPGYLLLLDIDATGRMSQIFPSTELIIKAKEAAANLIKPGEDLLVPNELAKKQNLKYIVTPPEGASAIVAILSDRQVQLLDLPDDAPRQRTESETIAYLADWTNKLRLLDRTTGNLLSAKWSFRLKPYLIK